MSQSLSVIHVTQPTPFSCAHACLSMVTGIPVEEIIARWKRPISFIETVTVLSEEGIMAVPFVPGYMYPFSDDGVYLTTVPSLNRSGVTHSVLVEYYQDEVSVHDPNKGREGILFYTEDNYWRKKGHPPMGFTATLKLVSLRDHKATPERIARMRALLDIPEKG